MDRDFLALLFKQVKGISLMNELNRMGPQVANTKITLVSE